ncbi:MAG: DUF1501 domain-containing protein [Chloracidobacterium sp.]|nr:DUF1501 domain-containing protein [Chloracidobacterium sp.]MCC6826583.1 DUF1501 domain-containing protein [Acidobacteriota bacterium]MCO5333880.1 DUF1501 domain-containing protein [Pyrinomonadaceae bacterium]
MKVSRRDFLKSSAGCALGMASLATQMHHFGTISAFAQAAIDKGEAATSYKALVLLYFAGGNDANNMIVPLHNDSTVSNYAAYTAARSTQGLALPATGTGALLPITVPRMNGLTYGLHPNFGPVTNGINNGIYELWGQGKLAFVANVGNLMRPLTKAQYQSSPTLRPYQLFSHSDQIAQSQAGISGSQIHTGWGGRISDKMTTAGPIVPMITSISGAQLFTSGQVTASLAIADSGTSLANVLHPSGFGTTPTGTNLARFNAFNSLRQQDLLTSHHLAAASHITDMAIAADTVFQSSVDTTVTFPNTSIGRQLRQVARLIKNRSSLGVARQIFYVQIGNFDTHTNQLSTQGTNFSQLSQALRAFWDELAAQTTTGGDDMQQAVTTFTLSDFSRTFNPAGSGSSVGSDHGWGSHALVLGGSVNGGNFYGSLRPDGTGDYFPTLTLGGPDDVDSGTSPRGRWLPTTSVEQYAAALARWFGLPQDAETLSAVFPNLQFFPGTYSQLDFMQP